ncbi:AMP-binding protein [Lentzea flava]|uniref:Fatty-acyl-CoA synthase n=1 Tax=Lentzea flava TaxID=103732 RepID=A0ABQ2VFH0_9PSEU|nr:AMP-binding protein [Lentzea flava]MCP2205043.1 fatty-acyl-CoA synthase [Lentzea flava]GGU82967.1 fatty-acyl-CoA synthase [Lentzea flava]
MSVREKLDDLVHSLGVISRSGLIDIRRPYEIVRARKAMNTYGPLAGPAAVAALKSPSAIGLVDELGPLTFGQLDRRANALGRAWLRRGLGEDAVIGLLARDHRGAVSTMIAAGKLGATLVPLNTGIGTRELADVVKREGVTFLVHDEEFTGVVADLPSMPTCLAWTEEEPEEKDTIEKFILGSTSDEPLPVPRRPGRLILLTSGTGGTPKGAERGIAKPLAVAQFLDRIPLRAGETTVIAAPLFHGTGLSQFIMSFALGNAVVVLRRFAPEMILSAVEQHRATALVVVPTMLQRLVNLGKLGHDTSSLRIILVAGAALSPDLGTRALDLFGEVVHNMYGGTEVSVVTVATPQDLRAAPGTVGRPPVGCHIALLDETGRHVSRPGVQGRVFVRSDLTFHGYTDGNSTTTINGMVFTGDVGHLDNDGRLFIDGRDDDMIISGGENVYPVEVENALADHPDVADAAVVGVDDDEFGQRLKGYVVPVPGANITAKTLEEFIRTTLARHKVPREIVIVDELPRNPTGKILRRSLSDLG